jgi:hypothetical protein
MNNNNKSDELRSRVVVIAADMSYGIHQTLEQIRAAIRTADHTEGDVGLAWKKGLTDALTLMRNASDAQTRYTRWLLDVSAARPDESGLTAEERIALFGREV